MLALVLALAVGSSLVHGAAPLVLGATFVWLVLGYAFYSWVSAAAGSMVERRTRCRAWPYPSAPRSFSATSCHSSG